MKKSMTRAALLPALLLLTNCSAVAGMVTQFQCTANYADARYETSRVTNYPVPNTTRSPRGIAVGPGVDPARVDALTSEVEDCLGVSIQACGIHAVIIAPDWFTINSAQVFPCLDGIQGLCAGVVQWPATIITTPNLAAFKHELIHVVTRRLHGDPVFRCQ